MDLFDQIIEALELERELGTRTVEIDRALLIAPARENPPPKRVNPLPTPAPKPAAAPAASSVPTPPPVAPAQTVIATAHTPQSDIRDLAFFTGRPLTPAGEELFNKMIVAIKYTRDRVYVNDEAANAKVIILMGAEAHRKYAPQVKAVRGKWFELGKASAVTTFSPDFILSHFIQDSKEMNAAKKEVWEVLKSAVVRIGGMG